MGWLNGWTKRVKITIDQTDIDAALANFPILLYLSSASGRNAEDITFIFDEIGANKLKIAVTTSDGETQCYVEVEYWDSANEKAWLWVKVPSISAIADTDLYLYYDNTHADNTDYVGDPDSIPAMNVWDTNFKAVWHMNDLTTSTVIDSTSNPNNGTKKAANEPIEANGKIGKAQDFDGVNDVITVAHHSSLEITEEVTLEAWYYRDTTGSGIFHTIFGSGWAYPWLIRLEESAEANAYMIRFRFADNTHTGELQPDTPTATAGEFRHVAGTFNKAEGRVKLYVNGVEVGNWQNNAWKQNLIVDATKSFYLGGTNTNTNLFDGKLDEMRISNAERSAAWIKASYETERDHLLDWGSEETEIPPSGILVQVM